MVFDIFTLVEAIWIILPAFAANGLVPILKGRHAIDGGRSFLDRPLFGPGKTWEGLLFGTMIGGAIAFIQQLAHPYLPWNISPVALNIIPMTIMLGLFLGFGAMFGDLIGSFLKRRFGLGRGRPAPLLDQEDFLLGALLFASFVITLEISWVILLVVITPIVHWIASIIGYVLRIKREPW
ncbi:MAG: CDP-2,3-bis-(O-geranylgeranyl)-sn-glycerol synthase [Candidatus Aenigmarchaeota archaeon]|nr:CDP-2,3-bis-(O-geranylgeranyl)-sn-glycerol synthase [Candidatus Aenigmarchaeota archaeon]